MAGGEQGVDLLHDTQGRSASSGSLPLQTAGNSGGPERPGFQSRGLRAPAPPPELLGWRPEARTERICRVLTPNAFMSPLCRLACRFLVDIQPLQGRDLGVLKVKDTLGDGILLTGSVSAPTHTGGWGGVTTAMSSNNDNTHTSQKARSIRISF